MIKSDDSGKLILRVLLGILILLHGISKLRTGVSGISGMVASHGLPAALAYLVYIGEVLAPVLLIIGLYTRVAAVVVVINMLFAFGLVHTSQITSLNGQGGWQLELQGMFLFTAVAVALMGAGRFSLGGTSGRYN